MKLANQYLFYKNLYKETLILIHSGNFFYTFLEDATLMNYLFGYKIVDNKVGFPISIIERIKSKLNCLKVDYVIVKNDDYYLNTFKDFNTYSKIREEANEISEKKGKLEDLYKKIEKKVEVDESNLQRIIDYVNEL